MKRNAKFRLTQLCAALFAAASLIVVSGCQEMNKSPVEVSGVKQTSMAPGSSSSDFKMDGVDARVADSGVCLDTGSIALAAPTRTFYVDALTGNDAANGKTPATAWKTLAKANSSAQAGDLFLLSGTFSGQYIRPNVSGTADRKIVFQALAGGAPAVIDHGKYDVILWLDGRQHIVVDGLEIRNDIYPILLRGGANNNVLRNLWVHDVGAAVQILQSSDNRIESSRISRCGTGPSASGECVRISDGSSRNVLARNTIEYGGHGTINVGGDGSSPAPSIGNVVVSNDLSNAWSENVAVTGTAQRTVLECNKLHDARSGIQITAQASIVRFNEIYSNTSDGVQLLANTYGGAPQNSASNQIYNNVVWGNGGAGLLMEQKNAGVVKDNVIENNAFWGNNAGATPGASRLVNDSYQDVWVDLTYASTVWPARSLNGNEIRNNVMAKDNADVGKGLLTIVRSSANGGNQYYTMTTAQTTFTGMSGNVQADPMFVNAVAHDFQLRDFSPAVDAGLVITGVKYIGGGPDVGAHESHAQAAPPPAPPAPTPPDTTTTPPAPTPPAPTPPAPTPPAPTPPAPTPPAPTHRHRHHRHRLRRHRRRRHLHRRHQRRHRSQAHCAPSTWMRRTATTRRTDLHSQPRGARWGRRTAPRNRVTCSF